MGVGLLLLRELLKTLLVEMASLGLVSRVLAGLAVSQQLVSPAVLQLSFYGNSPVSLTLDTSLPAFPGSPFLGDGLGGSQSLALAADVAREAASSQSEGAGWAVWPRK